MSCLLMAQEQAGEAEESVEGGGWSNGTKMTLLAIWGLVVLILTVRTFRNKAEM